MRRRTYWVKSRLSCWMIVLLMLAGSSPLLAQSPDINYIIKDGKMLIELSKQLSDAALDSFIAKYELYDLDLKQFIKTNSPDSLRKLGWKLEKNSRDQLIISKLLRGYDKFSPADKIIFAEKKPSYDEIYPLGNKEIKYVYNGFWRKSPFLIKDSMVTFFLRNNSKAEKVMLAGTFNQWNPNALSMTQTDSGWIANVKLGPGKHWYKFIVDDNWTVDTDNTRVENDGRGNDNSVFFKSNIVFRLNGFEHAKKVFLSGSFKNWKPRELLMNKTATGWQLPLYLAEGTHTYRFVVDGNWMSDPGNKDRLPNEFNDFNSVIRIGEPYTFKLDGYTDAKQVVLSGSFNNWREDELLMHKTAHGWELPYTLGAGNYEYRYRVDGKWVTDPKNNPLATSREKRPNAYLVIGANHVFRLKGFNTATTVFLAGDFNNWAPNTYLMKREGDDWVLNVHLARGKHTYKFIVDGKWIADPGNKLWEQNEFSSGNSVIWFDPYQTNDKGGDW